MVQNPYLAHYGILGMKWGRTKAEDLTKLKKDVDAIGAVANKAKESYKPQPKKRDLSDISDDDLKKKVERLALEKRFNELSPGKISNGQQRLKTTLEVVGATITVTSSALALAATIKAMQTAAKTAAKAAL